MLAQKKLMKTSNVVLFKSMIMVLIACVFLDANKFYLKGVPLGVPSLQYMKANPKLLFWKYLAYLSLFTFPHTF